MASPNKPLFRSFRLNITVRILLIIAASLALALVLTHQAVLFLPVGIGLVLVLLAFSLIRYIEKSNRDLTHFLLSIRQGAFTESYSSSGQGVLRRELGQAMDDIIAEFSRLAAEKELHYQYLQTINNNINIGLVAFDDDGTIRTVNPAAKALLGQSRLQSINDLLRVDSHLHDIVVNAKPEQRQLAKVVVNQELVQFSLFLKEIRIRGERVRVLLVQDVNPELEEKEIDAWQQLLGVMTHEIMNSITPIASLSDASKKILFTSAGQLKSAEELSCGNLQDVGDSVNTIAQRSKGLLRFVKSFRDYSAGLNPSFEIVDLKALVEHVGALMAPEMKRSAIKFDVRLPATSLTATIDGPMIEQAVLNLLKNAIDAVHDQVEPSIILRLSMKDTARARIVVEDNGAGIPDEVLPKIFVPFYSTKTGGTGIGLSLTKQIVTLHHGQLRVQTRPEGGVKFIVDLPVG